MPENKLQNTLNRYFQGVATSQEMKLIEDLEQFACAKVKRNIWESEEEKELLKQTMFRNIQKKQRSRRQRTMWRYAAAAVLVFGMLLGAVLHQMKPEEVLVYNDSSTLKTLALADGSVVKLNRNSSLKYRSDFNTKNRAVELHGEAYFEVEKNEALPFTIETNGLTTRVLGTKFNIKEQNTRVEVTVSEGQVKVYDSNSSLNIAPNQQAVYNTASGELSSHPVNAQLCDYWSKEQIKLDNVQLLEFAHILEALYGTSMSFSDSLQPREQFTISFRRNEELASIINRVNTISEVKLTLKPKHMIEVSY